MLINCRTLVFLRNDNDSILTHINPIICKILQCEFNVTTKLAGNFCLGNLIDIKNFINFKCTLVKNNANNHCSK